MRKKLNSDHLTLGVCYYPEHWDPSLWQDDLRRMKEMGLETVRIAEFAWNKFEPREGEFTFDFFDSFMNLAKQEGIQVIFCTPTATPPAWMSHKYPEILNADMDGNLIQHGMRRHYSLNSEKYRFFVARITEKLAEHYGKHPSIVAWQLDNEINCECHLYYSENDHRAFRAWLKQRFETLEALNHAIGATFWNQTYTDWEEVFLPRRTNDPGHSNPHMELLQRRFISDTVIDFFKLQTDILRKYSKASITTNGIFRYVDYHRLTDEVLDFITFDNYPNFQAGRTVTPHALGSRVAAYKLTRTRSISPLFGIMEQQSGPGGWTYKMLQAVPKPGQLRLWSMQAIAHGADYVSYFRWRTCTYGTEIYWHGILNYDNRDNRRVTEVKETFADLGRIQGVTGKEYVAEIALLRDYDNEWDSEIDEWHGEADRISYDNWFIACQKKHVPFDLVYVNDKTELTELKKYKLVIYPHPTILTEQRVALLRAYAEEGGTVIFGCRTGYKDPDGKCLMMPMPGYAASLCGAEVEEFTFLSSSDEMQFVKLGDQRVSAPCFNDVLSLTDGESVGVFENNFYGGKCAVSLNRVGKGKVYYFGGAFGEDTARGFLALEQIGAPLDLDCLIDLPEEVELAIRGEYIFLLNHTAKSLTLPCAVPFWNLITESECGESITLSPFDVAVLKKL